MYAANSYAQSYVITENSALVSSVCTH